VAQPPTDPFAALQLENARLREQARERGEYLERLAHELASPLTPLVGYLRLLSSGRLGDLSERQQQVVASMVQATGRLSRVLDGLSDFAALETGHYHVEPVPFDAAVVVDQAVAEHADQAHARHVSVEIRRPPRVDLRGDEQKLRQALSTLLDNAVRLSPHGAHVLVHVQDAHDRALFDVYDQGPGFSPEAQAALHARREERLGHTGLSLPVARQIVEAHRGHLFVESPPKEQPDARQRYSGARVGLWIPKD
jgi:signal transduction histidine kinase